MSVVTKSQVVTRHLQPTMKDQFLFFPPELVYGESNSPPTVRDICNDGGLLKKILVKGEGWEHPKDHDDVIVKYEARLDYGTVVAKSDDGVEFTVKNGHFCPALSMAVKTMKKGEKVILTVKPQYGFGEKGKAAHGDEGSVPPNASLQITLEFVSWKILPTLPILPKLTVDKKVVKEGEGYECPNEGAAVKLKLIGKLQDGTVFFKKGHSDEKELFEFKTDEAQVILGLDKAVMTMKKGEVALLSIAPEYGFGKSESQQELAVVPRNSTLYYEVELVSFVKDKESWVLDNEEKIDMNAKEKLEAAAKKEKEGYVLFVAQKYARASKRYEMAVKFLEDDTSFSDEEKIDAMFLRRDCNLYNSMCNRRLKDYKQAGELMKKAEDAFGIEPPTPPHHGCKCDKRKRMSKRRAKKYKQQDASDFTVFDIDNRGANIYVIMFNKIKSLIGFLGQ